MITLYPLLAYVDPGSGLMVLQLISAAIVGLGFYLKRVRTWIGHMFKYRRKNTEDGGKSNPPSLH